jgi:hypothetical protein
LLDSHLIIFFEVLSGCDFFDQAVLVLVALVFDHLEMLFEIVEQLRKLVLFGDGVL